MINLIDKLATSNTLSESEFKRLLSERNPMNEEYLFQRARTVREKHYKNTVFIRGLIEISSFCKNNCYYCGIRASNTTAQRYRLTKEHILKCCEAGYHLGFRTFVLQGGEDPYYSKDIVVDIVSAIKDFYPDCAVTLSLGERSYEDYKAFKIAGADRYLLRHESANANHYSLLHPNNMLLKNRKNALLQLKDLGYQVGTGFMVGSPFQTVDNLVEDLVFIKQLKPDMIGIGPYIPHNQTPFSDMKAGSVNDTVFLLGILRLMLPKVLLPATTSLVTLQDSARNRAFLAGANVVMPNLSPPDVREKYSLYNNKKHTDTEAAEALQQLNSQLEEIGYKITVARGDVKK